MQGHKAMLGLVIVMGVLILAGTATLIGVVAHRLASPHPAGLAIAAPLPGQGAAAPVAAIADEPAGTRIVAIARQSDTLLSIALSGGGPDRVLVWDIAGGRRAAEISLAR